MRSGSQACRLDDRPLQSLCVPGSAGIRACLFLQYRQSRQGCLRSQGAEFTAHNTMTKERILEYLARMPFVPPPKLRNAHAQTIAGTVIPRRFKAVAENSE